MRSLRTLFGRVALLAALCGLLPGRVAAQLNFDRALACAGGSGNAPERWGPQNQVLDAQGNSYVTGQFNGTIALGNTLLNATQTPPNRLGPSDNFVAKLDATGAYLWAVQLGDNQSAYIAGLAVDAAGNVYLTGSFDSFSLTLGVGGPTLFNSSSQQEIFVAKLDGSSHQCLWARRAGGTDIDLTSTVAVNAAGEVYLIGTVYGGVADFGSFTLTAPSSPLAFQAKLSGSGVWMWARPIGMGRISVGSALFDAQGNCYLVVEKH